MELFDLIDLVPASIYWKDTSGRYLGCNRYMLEMAGMRYREDIIGKRDTDLPWKDSAKLLYQIDCEVMAAQICEQFEETPRLYNQEERTYLSIKKPFFEHGELKGLIGVSIDISDKKRSEALKYEKECVEHEMQLVQTFAGALAHELRTPLSTITSGISGLEQFLPKLLAVYQQAKNDQQVAPEHHIAPSKFSVLERLCDSMKRQSVYANLFIDMALMNIRHKTIDRSGFMKQSIKITVDNLLEKYPLDEIERQKICWQAADYDDFYYHGDQILTLHVLFNLLKNALYYIRCKPEASITISLKKTNNHHCLLFTDTGPGIPASILPNIFKAFYTKRTSGSGVGLAFCQLVMQSYGGAIRCESVEGEYTTFILEFPVMDEATP